MANKGNIIALLRKEAGYTQKSLAKALNVTDKAISKWERGICLPETSLLPRLSRLLDADIELLLSKGDPADEWEGVIDLRNYEIDLSQVIYDKPQVYLFLSHFLLLGIKRIHVFTSNENRHYLSSALFRTLGFEFDSRLPSDKNLMILRTPCFLFGSDLTRQFQTAMVTGNPTKLVLENGAETFLFCPKSYFELYERNPELFSKKAESRTLGRGMMCITMDNADKNIEVAQFIQMYQRHAQIPIFSLEEIAVKQSILTVGQALRLAEKKPYYVLLSKWLKKFDSKP